MSFKDKLFCHHLLCCIFGLLTAVYARWNDLTPGDLANAAKRMGEPALGQEPEFNLGPFESVNDQFYLSEGYFERIQENLRRAKHPENLEDSLRELRKSGSGRVYLTEVLKPSQESVLEFRKDDFLSSLTKAQKMKGDDDGDEVSSLTCKVLLNVVDKLPKIGNGMTEIKKLSKFFNNFTETLEKLKNELSTFNDSESLNRLLDAMDKLLGGKMAKSRKNHRQRFPFSIKNQYKTVNNVTFGNQYQIGNLFVFNQQLDKSTGQDGGPGQGEQRIFGGKISSEVADTFQASKQQQKDEENENFTKMASLQGKYVNLEQISQMSKIIDFVERYHGIMSDSNVGINDLLIWSGGSRKETRRTNFEKKEKSKEERKIEREGPGKRLNRVNQSSFSTIGLRSKENQRKNFVNDANLNFSNLSNLSKSVISPEYDVREETAVVRRKGKFSIDY